MQSVIHAFSYTTELDYITTETKLVVARQTTAGGRIPNNNEIRHTSKAGFN
jgi:hypothetical protein